MNYKNENLTKTITKMVKSLSAEDQGKKAIGTKLTTIQRDIPITRIDPFSK